MCILLFVHILQESRKYRDLLGAFWDKVLPSAPLSKFSLLCCSVSFVPYGYLCLHNYMQLSVDEIKEVVSLHDVSIKVSTRFTLPVLGICLPGI